MSDEINKDTVDYRDPTPFDDTKLNSVSEISQAIRHKLYGKDTREALAQQGEALIKLMQETGGNQSAEVIAARGNHELLSMREDAQDNAIDKVQSTVNAAQSTANVAQSTANSKFDTNQAESYLKSITAIPETFANLAAIKAKYPSGKNGLMVAADNGHKYIWANGTWTDAGVYQSVGIADGTVTAEKLAPDVNKQIDALSNALARRIALSKPYLENSSATGSITASSTRGGVNFTFYKSAGFAYTFAYLGKVADLKSSKLDILMTNTLLTASKMDIICANTQSWTQKFVVAKTVEMIGGASVSTILDLNSLASQMGLSDSDDLLVLIADRGNLNNNVNVSLDIDVLLVNPTLQSKYAVFIDSVDHATTADSAKKSLESNKALTTESSINAGAQSLLEDYSIRGELTLSPISYGVARLSKIQTNSVMSYVKGLYLKVKFNSIDSLSTISLKLKDILGEVPAGAKKISPNFVNIQSTMADWGSDPATIFVTTDTPINSSYTIDLAALITNTSEKKKAIYQAQKYCYLVIAYFDGTAAGDTVFDYEVRATTPLEDAVVIATDVTSQARAELVEDVKTEVIGKKYITAWGDSLTAQAGWTELLAQKSGLTLYNAGTGGDSSRTIVARQGADAIELNNVTIPGDTTPVTLATNPGGGFYTFSGQRVGPLRQGGVQHFNPCHIGNITGSLAWTGKDYADDTGGWDFTRDAPGDAITITRPTALRTAYDVDRNAPYLMVIFMGQNDGSIEPDEFVRKHRIMIEHAHAENTLILGLHTGTAESRADYEAAMREAFGRYFFSLRQYLASPIKDSAGTITSCYGLDDAGLTPTADDLAKIAVGQVPLQLLKDGIHYTDAVKTVVGNAIFRYCCDLNIF